ncbi:MAG: transglutaminase family protein [Rubrivivax sp.]|nr:transglutaminase family protein [Rubrivivax sp.]
MSTPATAPAFSPASQPTASPAPISNWTIDCQLAYELNDPTHFIFQIHAWHGADQQVLAESLELSPGVASHVYLDPLSHHRTLRLQAPQGVLKLHYQATVHVAPRLRDTGAAELPVQDLPDALVHQLMPTRYCESDLLARAAYKLFGNLPPGYARVQAISDWIHDNVDYVIGTTDTTTTSCDVFRQRAGVCRDFAHLGVTFCRALNIPARLAVGYVRFNQPPPDFHAVFEAYLGGQWVLFDPTQMAPVEHLVRIACGRDAKDVAFSTIFGQATMLTMTPDVQPAA